MLSLRFVDSETGLSVIVDDDDRVAYAYLRGLEEEIVGDVWLYNVGPTPTDIDLTDSSAAPFLNPAGQRLPVARPESADDVSVEFSLADGVFLADVRIRGERIARLSIGSSPGWNVLATHDSPFAQVWLKDDAER